MVPLAQPVRGRDGREMAEVLVPRGTILQLDYQASNRNKALWGEDAAEWRPARWLGPLPAAVEDARVPGVYSHLCVFALVRFASGWAC